MSQLPPEVVTLICASSVTHVITLRLTSFSIGDLAKDEAFMARTWSEIVEVLSQFQPDITLTLETIA